MGDRSESSRRGKRVEGLDFVGYVCVPEGGGEHCAFVFGLLVCVYHVNVVEVAALGNTGGGVLVQTTEVLTEFTLGVDGEVLLVPEEDYSSCGD